MSRETDPNNSHQYVANADGARAQVVAGAEPVVVEATISSGESLSAAVDLGDGALVRIAMPSSWTTADLTFQTSYDGTTYSDLYDADGNEYDVSAAASREIIVPIADLIGARYVKVRSGTTGTPVNQGADRTINLVVAP